MTDQLHLDPVSQPPAYRGEYLIHRLLVPAAEFDPELAARAVRTRGKEFHELAADEMDRLRVEAEQDVRPWARRRRYHAENCPGCTGHLRVGGVPED